MKRTLLVSGSLVLAAAGQAIIVDDFMSGSYAVSIQTGNDLAHQAGTMLGSQRRTYVEVQSNPLNQFLDFTVGSGFAISSSGALMDAVTEVGYGDITPLDADLSSQNAFVVHFLSNDLPMQLNLRLTSVSGGQTETVNVGVSAGTSFDVIVPFASFGTFTAFNDIDEVNFQFQTPVNGDFVLSGIEAVPEPATMLALGAGLAAIAARRRRR